MLEIINLTITDERKNEVIVKDVNFTLERNDCLGIVGESGSGKSITSKAILGLVPSWLKVTGTVQFDGKDLVQMKTKEIRKIRGKRICMILQDAMSAFDPLYTIGSQMIESLCENLEISKQEAELLSIVELEKMRIKEPAQVLKKYPHQLSGGMLQRCMIAIAMAVKPDIIIADEPTTALDSINQNEVVTEFERLRSELDTSVIFISHDLGVIQRLAQTVLVMKEGKQVEYGKVEEVFLRPKHEYTRFLIHTRVQLTKSFSDAMRKDHI
ncbi:ABC transporter ATP-binding protein [Paenibacillus sp. Marseille-Q4541]|uniref:ABC transporter ATP-binding protein n=1 Tax=Paenibacillus sp. Marseille-Q4541 TaxID=2831522 RepID=UPI0032D5A8B4